MAAASPLAGTAPGTAEVELVIGGMTCAACAARVRAKLNKLDGVTASVNLSTERAWVIAPAHVSARDLVDVVQAVGYTADVAAPLGQADVAAPLGQDAAADATAAADDAAVRRLRRRLVLALVFFVPLTDLSIVPSLFPWARFPGRTSASWVTTAPSTGSRPGACGPASGSWFTRGSGSPPTARSCPASPPSTGA